jgi:hypothetical protein
MTFITHVGFFPVTIRRDLTGMCRSPAPGNRVAMEGAAHCATATPRTPADSRAARDAGRPMSYNSGDGFESGFRS